MTQEFLQFLNELLIPLDLHLKQRTPLLGKVAESDKVESKIYIYLHEEGGLTMVSDDWVGRYVIVEPNTTIAGRFRISFMEAIKDIKTDYGPSINVNIAAEVVMLMIADYLIDGTVPDVAVDKQ